MNVPITVEMFQSQEIYLSFTTTKTMTAKSIQNSSFVALLSLIILLCNVRKVLAGIFALSGISLLFILHLKIALPLSELLFILLSVSIFNFTNTNPILLVPSSLIGSSIF